jgi:hypothetical protein
MMRPFGNQESLEERLTMMSSNGLNIRSQRVASIEREAGLRAREQSLFRDFHHPAATATGEFGFEILDSSELALRLKVKESWVVEQSKRSRTRDPIPVFRLGKHRRYRWGSPEMNDWLARRAGHTTTSKTWSR